MKKVASLAYVVLSLLSLLSPRVVSFLSQKKWILTDSRLAMTSRGAKRYGNQEMIGKKKSYKQVKKYKQPLGYQRGGEPDIYKKLFDANSNNEGLLSFQSLIDSR